MINIKKRNITIMSDDELAVVSGGYDTSYYTTDRCGDPGYSTEADSCTCIPDSE